MKDPMKSRDKITQKMSRDGLTEQNQTTGESELISKRIQDADFQKTPEQQAAQDAAQLQGALSTSSPLPHAPEHFSKPQGRSRRARHGAYRRGTDPESLEKSCPASAGSGSVKGAAVPSAIYRRGTGNAGAGKVHQEIGQSRRPFGRSAGGTSPKEEIAAAI